MKEIFDLVIENASLVNVLTSEIQENVSLAIKKGIIQHLYFGNEYGKLKTKKTISAKSSFIAPGFMDGHIHIESSMLSLVRFAQVAVPHGTTAVFIDPHEIANVLGMGGIMLFIRESHALPLKVFVEAPSCVPATKGLETSGATISEKEIEDLLDRKEIIGLGEVMDFLSVISRNPEIMTKISSALERNKPVEGHAPGLIGEELDKYLSAGIQSDHESTSGKEALEKIRKGMWLEIREGTVMKNLQEILPYLLKKGISLERCLLVSDDRDVNDLLDNGHLDYTLRKAVNEGLDPVKAIKMVTINTASRFHLENKFGSVSPGKVADLVLLNDLENFRVLKVIVNGEVVAENYQLRKEVKEIYYPEFALKTIKAPEIKEQDLYLRKSSLGKRTKIVAIQVKEGEAYTRKSVQEITLENGVAQPSIKNDVLPIAVVERHHYTGNIGKGFIKGLHLKEGALATSIGHDAHNITVTGCSYKEMAEAVDVLKKISGGLVAVGNGKVKSVPLPLAGLMSIKDPVETGKKIGEILNFVRGLGSPLKNPFTVLSFIPLSVIPEIRLTDKGLVDVAARKIVSPFL